MPGSDLSKKREPESGVPPRREFLRTATAPVLLAALGIALPSCKTNVVGIEDTPGITIDGNRVILDLTDPANEGLTQAGGFLLIRVAQVMAINIDGTTIRAFTSTCTHLQCTITAFDNDRFRCPCHGSQFDTSGEVVQGPADRNLQEFDVSRNGDVVTITR